MRVINTAEKHVVVSDEGLRSLHEADAELADALYLNVSFNGLEHLEGVEQARSLQVLNVSHNALKSLYETAALCHLHVLKCSYNEITELSWVTPLVNLRELWVNENRIESPELEHFWALTKLTRLVIHPNPCTQSEDYTDSVVKRLPWLKRVDTTLVDQELRDRAERYEARAEPVLDATPPSSPGNAPGPETAAEPPSPPPPPPAPAPVTQAPKAKKKVTTEEFMRNFPVQDFIPVESNSTSSDGGNDGETTYQSPSTTGSESTDLALEPQGATAAAQISPGKQAGVEGQHSPVTRSPQKVLPTKAASKGIAATTTDGSATDSEGGISSILGAVLSLPMFGADSFLKKQPVTKTHPPKKPKAAPAKSESIATEAGADDNFESFQQDSTTMMFPNSTVNAVNIRSDGSAVAKWPSGTVAVSVDKEPGGFRIYAAHKDGTIALSFVPAGVGFINYYPSGRMLISTSSSGDGLYFSSDGFTILRQWDSTGAMCDDKFEATDSLGDEPNGALLCKLSDNLAVRVQLLPRQPVAPRNPIALRVYFATTSGIRRVFVNRPNAVGSTESKDECDAIFGKEPGKSAAKSEAAPPPPIAHSDLLGEIRAAVAGL